MINPSSALKISQQLAQYLKDNNPNNIQLEEDSIVEEQSATHFDENLSIDSFSPSHNPLSSPMDDFESYMQSSVDQAIEKYGKKAKPSSRTPKAKIASDEKWLEERIRKAEGPQLNSLLKYPGIAVQNALAGVGDLADIPLLPANIVGTIRHKDFKPHTFNVGNKIHDTINFLTNERLEPSNDVEQSIGDSSRFIGEMFGGGKFLNAIKAVKGVPKIASILNEGLNKLNQVEGIGKYPAKILKMYTNLVGSIFENPTLTQAGISSAIGLANQKLSEELGNETWWKRALPIISSIGGNIAAVSGLNKLSSKLTNPISEKQFELNKKYEMPHHYGLSIDPKSPYATATYSTVSNLLDTPGYSGPSQQRFNDINTRLNELLNVGQTPKNEWDKSASNLKSLVENEKKALARKVNTLQDALKIPERVELDSTAGGKAVQNAIVRKNKEMSEKSSKLMKDIMPQKGVKKLESFKNNFESDSFIPSSKVDMNELDTRVKDYIKEVKGGFEQLKNASTDELYKLLDQHMSHKAAGSTATASPEQFKIDFFTEKGKYSDSINVNPKGDKEYGYLIPKNTLGYLQEISSKQVLPKELKSFVLNLKNNNGIMSIEDFNMARKIFNTLDNQTSVKFGKSTLNNIWEAAKKDMENYFKRVEDKHPHALQKFKSYNKMWRDQFEDATRKKTVELWKAGDQKEKQNWQNYIKDLGGLNEDNIINKHYLASASPEELKTVLTELVKAKGLDSESGKFKPANVIKFFNTKDSDTRKVLQSMFDKAKIPFNIDEFRVQSGDAIKKLKEFNEGRNTLFGDVNKPLKQYFTDFNSLLTSDPIKSKEIFNKLSQDKKKQLLTDIIEYNSYPASAVADKEFRSFGKLNKWINSFTPTQLTNFQNLYNEVYPRSKTRFDEIQSFLNQMQRIANNSNKSGTSQHKFIRDFTTSTGPDAAIDFVESAVKGQLPTVKTRLMKLLLGATFVRGINKTFLTNPDFVQWGLDVRKAKTKPELYKKLIKGMNDKYLLLPNALSIKKLLQEKIKDEDEIEE